MNENFLFISHQVLDVLDVVNLIQLRGGKNTDKQEIYCIKQKLASYSSHQVST